MYYIDSTIEWGMSAFFSAMVLKLFAHMCDLRLLRAGYTRKSRHWSLYFVSIVWVACMRTRGYRIDKM